MFRFATRTFAQTGARMASTSASTAMRPRTLLGGATVAAGIAAGFVGYQNECIKIEIDEATACKTI